MNEQQKLKQLVFSSLGIAIVFVATIFIRIPNTIHGYINLGDGFILLFASILNPVFAFLVGGLGSGLADIAGGYGFYFFFTLLIKGMEGFMVSYLVSKSKKNKTRFLAYILGSIIMIIGYLIADSIINQSFWLGLAGVAGNLFQAGAGLLIAVFGFPLLKKIPYLDQ